MERASYNSLLELLRANRSVRRFRQSERISDESLRRIVDAVRFCASGRNLQPLKYILINDPEVCSEIFPLLKWAGYLTDWDGPEEGERPAAYVIQILDTSLTENPLCDEGLQLEALTLAACSMGYNSCIIKSFNIPELKKLLSIPEALKPSYVVALGAPAETVIIEEMKDGDIKYWRTPDGVHHTPKRSLDEIIIK